MAPRRKTIRRRPRRAKKTRSNMSKTVKAIVKKEIARSNENKIVTQNGVANTLPGNTYAEFVLPNANNGNQFRGLLPRMADGPEANQRVGNSITPKVLKVRGLLFFNGTVPESYDYTVRMMVLTHKSQKNQDDLTAVGTTYSGTVLWNSIGTSAGPTPYQGCDPYYNTLPINRRAWNVLSDKKYHLRKGPAVGSGGIPSQEETFMSPSRSVPFELVLTQKQLPAKLLYQSANADIPTNYAPILVMGWTDNTGNITVGNTTHFGDVQIQWTSSLIYEDA